MILIPTPSISCVMNPYGRLEKLIFTQTTPAGKPIFILQSYLMLLPGMHVHWQEAKKIAKIEPLQLNFCIGELLFTSFDLTSIPCSTLRVFF